MALVSLYLRALKYPGLDGFDPNDPARYQSLLVWLEHTKIRHYALEARQPLQSADGATWQAALQRYLADLACPVAWDNGTNHIPVLQWLLNHAVGLEYADGADEYNKHIDGAAEAAPAPQDWAPPALPPYPDAASPETRAVLVQVLEYLRVPFELQGAITPEDLRKAKGVLEAQVLPCLAEAARVPGGQVNAASVLSGFPLGFSTGDSAVDLAATVLRMLYIKDMRGLQDQIDAAIVGMQEITADPKTDAAAGKVGR